MAAHKKLPRLMWATIALIVMVAVYPASYGPVMRYAHSVHVGLNGNMPFWFKYLAEPLYAPLNWILEKCPESVQSRFSDYVWWWTESVLFP